MEQIMGTPFEKNMNGDSGNGSGGDAVQEGRRIYMGNLLYSVKPVDVEEFLKHMGFGGYEKIHISVDPISGRNPGYCFVEFPTAAEAEAALTELPARGASIFDRPVKVGPCRPKTNTGSSSNRDSNSRDSGSNPFTSSPWRRGPTSSDDAGATNNSSNPSTPSRAGGWGPSSRSDRDQQRGNGDSNSQTPSSSRREGPAFQRWGDWNGEKRTTPVAPREQGPYGALEHLGEMKARDDSDGRRLYVGGLGKMIDQEHNQTEMSALFEGFDV